MWRLASNPFNITHNDIGLPSSTGTVSTGLANILAAMMGVVGGLALVFIIVGALQMTLSAGDSKRVQQARETILYASIGVVVAVAGYAIVVFLANATSGTSK